MSFHLIARAVVWVQALALASWERTVASERGQSTAEYALVLLGVGAVALLVLGWAGSTNKVGKLLDAVFGQLTKHVKG